MNILRTTILAALLALFAAAPALAHKVTLFAYVEGDQIVVDAFYSRSNKVRQGKIVVADAASGEKLAEVTTDEAGAARFPVPQKALAARHDLKLTLVAGEGHQDDILVRASEFAPAAPISAEKPAAKASVTSDKAAPAKEAKVASGQAASQPAPQIDKAELEALVERAAERAVEKKIAPLRQMLERQAGDGPRMVEIVGGIGYILGLFGVAAFVAARRKHKDGR